MTAEQQGQWQTGCLSAKQQLDPTDKRRLAESDYRQGWNSYPEPASQPTTPTVASTPGPTAATGADTASPAERADKASPGPPTSHAPQATAHVPPIETEAASPPTVSPQIAALKHALEDARRSKSDADGAVKQAAYNLENARRSKSDADSAVKQAKDYYDRFVAWSQSPPPVGPSVIGPNGNQIAAEVGRRLNEASSAVAQAQTRVATADQAVAQAEGVLSLAQTQAGRAATRVQAEERRLQILPKLGAHCVDPGTAEETRQCESDYFKANFGSSQENFRADLGPELAKHYDDLRAAEQRAREEARIQAQAQAKADAQRAYQAEVAKSTAYQETHGYTSVSFNNFLLDGKELAESQTKVSVAGIYQRNGAFTALFPNQMAIMREEQNINIPVLTEDATREIRSYFLKCDENPSFHACPITVLGTATMCTKTNLLAGSSEVPCIKVEDGWNVAPP
jgi:hypothetical protein